MLFESLITLLLWLSEYLPLQKRLIYCFILLAARLYAPPHSFLRSALSIYSSYCTIFSLGSTIIISTFIFLQQCYTWTKNTEVNCMLMTFTQLNVNQNYIYIFFHTFTQINRLYSSKNYTLTIMQVFYTFYLT